MFRKEFSEIILETGMVPLKDLRPLLAEKDPLKISELNLLKLPFFDDVKFAKAIAQKNSLIFLDLGQVKIQDSTLALIKKSDVVKYRCLPVQKTGKAVSVAIFDPSIAHIKNELQSLFQHPVDLILTNIASWSKIFDRITDSVEDLVDTIQEVQSITSRDEEDIRESDIGDDIIKYVNKVLAESYVKKASDIHIEPYEKSFRIRFRVDGTLKEVASPPLKFLRPIISRLKIMAQLNISERRRPQDGRIKLVIGGSPIDYRVSSLPCLFGEKIVLRLLDNSNLQLDMTKLGMEKDQLEIFQEAIHRPYGMCLVTGPTGSGKTTTLYSALSDLNRPNVNISTVEDPVEFNLEGINQVNVKNDIGLTFAAALKSFLRQDPDIIMLGEIRDLEAGETGIEAALTGHMVLSTLHTNDAPSTITRLLNMGIEPFLVTGAVNVVVAQRLCRMICENCKTETQTPVEYLRKLGLSQKSAESMRTFKGEGCESCGNSGHKGRVAIYEVLRISPSIRDVILKDGTAEDIKRVALKEGFKTLRMSALIKVSRGLTTLEEALANSASDS